MIKLRTKIALICAGILAIVVVTCSVMFVLQTRKNSIDLSITYSKQAQVNIEKSFSEMMNYYSKKNDSEILQKSLAYYCFSNFAEDGAVLIRGDETIYSESAISPQNYISPKGEEQEIYNGVIDKQKILIIASKTIINDQEYSIFTVQNINWIYENVSKLALKFLIVDFIAVVLGILTVVLGINRAMGPLYELQAVSKKIAGGEYFERVKSAKQDEIGEIANNFNQMATAVEKHINDLIEMTERQRVFIAGAAHEFKTPLAAVQLYVDALQNVNLHKNEREKALQCIYEQSIWLEKLRQKLLELIVLRTHVQKKHESVAELFSQVSSTMKQTLSSRQLSLQCYDNSVYIDMDSDLMRSLLVNLIDNAAKASKPGQIITLIAQDHLIEVMDCGTGIPEEEIPRITEPFYMVDKSRSKKNGGSGLGLALVKEVAAAHSAELSITSKLGEGTAIGIHFPW